MLGLQVRPPGAPGPLTLKEVEELEQLTQKLMQDMEHPQRQNVAASGEPAAPSLGVCPLRCHCAGHTRDSTPWQASSCLFIFSGLRRVLWPVPPAPGTRTARGSRSGAAVPHHLLHLPSV